MMNWSLNGGYYLIVGGMAGIVFKSSHFIWLLLSLEVVLLGLNWVGMSHSILLDDIQGSLWSMFLLTVAAAEAGLGLSLVVATFRVKGNMSLLFLNLLKG